LTLEKACKSVAPKFDYWRSIIPGQVLFATKVKGRATSLLKKTSSRKAMQGIDALPKSLKE
jgi:hypothetical protein